LGGRVGAQAVIAVKKLHFGCEFSPSFFVTEISRTNSRPAIKSDSIVPMEREENLYVDVCCQEIGFEPETSDVRG
jgi:hypothetical protein